MIDKAAPSSGRHHATASLFHDTRGSEMVSSVLLVAVAAILLLGYMRLAGWTASGTSKTVARLIHGRDDPASDSQPEDELPPWSDPEDAPSPSRPRADDDPRDDTGSPGGGGDADTDNRNGDTGDDSDEDRERDSLEDRLDDIELRYRKMIARARRIGWNVAADNLQRFVDGTGEGKGNSGQWIDPKWLQTFAVVKAGEDRNRNYFESETNSQGDCLKSIAQGLNDGQTAQYVDYWETLVTSYSPTKELSFASGASTLKTSGQFTLTRQGDEVAIEGTMTHDWFDPYDWHENLGFYVPGFGDVSDADALLLQQHRGARPFTMRSRWKQVWRGTYSLSTGKFDWSA